MTSTKSPRKHKNVQAVTFNIETKETSLGGTQTTGRIKTESFGPRSPRKNYRKPFCKSSSNAEEYESNKENLRDRPDSDSSSLTSTTLSSSSSGKSILEAEESIQPQQQVTRRNTTEGKLGYVRRFAEKVTPIKGMQRHSFDFKTSDTPECFSAVDLPRSYAGIDECDFEVEQEDKSSLTVAVRVRPFSSRELLEENLRCAVAMEDNQTTVTTEVGNKYDFNYDFSFWSFDDDHDNFADQEKVYEKLAWPLLVKVFKGYNACLFAYGQTGSGKSYSMMGHGSDVGIIPRFSEELFKEVERVTKNDMVKVNVEISFFEIYNEKIHDLLASTKIKNDKKSPVRLNEQGKIMAMALQKKTILKVREHPVLGPYIEGLSSYVVNSFEDIQAWLVLGNKNRATASTGMNDKSSRSHSNFSMVLTQTKTEIFDGQPHDHSITSKINLVDLAGSERQCKAQATGERLREGISINKSLMTLGKVISLLSEQSTGTSSKKKKLFVPYRESVLTWLLKESLGGNSKTTMLATISPANRHIDETLSTLRYASQARSIVNVVRINEDPNARIIRLLHAEIAKLRSRIGFGDGKTHACSLAEILKLKEELQSREKEVEQINRSWKQKLQQAEERKLEESRQLEKSGITLSVDSNLPNLVNLNQDPQLSETLLYLIKEGQTRVGRMKANSRHNVQLIGTLIADDHCIINNVNNVVSITPIDEAPTYVNGHLIAVPTILLHGDRIVLGGDHYFRLNHSSQQIKKNSSDAELKDFESAKQELMSIQEERLHLGLEVKRQAEEEMQIDILAEELVEKQIDLQKSKFEEGHRSLSEILHNMKERNYCIQQLKHELARMKSKRDMDDEDNQSVLSKCLSHQERPLIALIKSLQAGKEQAEKKLNNLKESERNMPFFQKDSTANIYPAIMKHSDLFQTYLLISEANKISQELKKDVIFTREDIMEGDEMKTLVKLSNTKLNICTYCTMAKFKQKLILMRDIYENGEKSSDDDVFADATEMWKRDDDRFTSPVRLPKERGLPVILGSPSRNLADSRKSCSPDLTRRRLSSLYSESASKQNEFELFLCINLMKHCLDEFTGGRSMLSVCDRILCHCKEINQATTTLLDSFGNSAIGNQEKDTSGHSVTKQNWIQLVHSFEQIGVYSFGVDVMIGEELVYKMRDKKKRLGENIVHFLQAYGSGLGGFIQEAGFKIIDSVVNLSKTCGELALTTDCSMETISDPSEHLGSSDHMVDHDLQQAFLDGCDMFVDRTMHDAVKKLEDCEMKAQMHINVSSVNMNFKDIPKHLEILVSITKMLLEKSEEIQIEINNSLRESIHSKHPLYYETSYKCSRILVSSINCLVETIATLLLEVEGVMTGEQERISTITENSKVIEQVTGQISQCIKDRSQPHLAQVECSKETSVLFTSYLKQLDQLGLEVTAASNRLVMVGLTLVNKMAAETKKGRSVSEGHNTNTSCAMVCLNPKQELDAKRKICVKITKRNP